MLYLSIYGSTVLLLDLGRFLSFLILYPVDRTPWTGVQPTARPLPTHKTTQTQNELTQTSMPWFSFLMRLLFMYESPLIYEGIANDESLTNECVLVCTAAFIV
jgi:hypothetical protein